MQVPNFLNIFLNLIMSNELIRGPLHSLSENVIKPAVNIPLNLARNKFTCNPFEFKAGDSVLMISIIPKGNCWNCCPVDIEADIRFLLYNRNNSSDTGVSIHPFNKPGAARAAGVNSSWPFEIFIHGFSETAPGDSGRHIKEAYLSRPENYNIILVQWSTLSSFPWYTQARENVKIVAKVLRNFLEVFHDTGEIPIHKVHLIGFSLGSHVASYTGKLLRRDLKIPRITALDAAFPEFSLRDSSRRLDRSDAEYVDVIHTDSGIFGIPIPIGHADFYPNGGRALQPGCQPSYLYERRFLNLVLACSHVRAWKLYAESVRNPQAFPATECKDWKNPLSSCNFTLDAYLGLANNKTFGQFYLTTNPDEPYSRSVRRQLSD